jgi:ABC-type Mn2+/Zn2+ transport system ATPase subunit
VFAGLDAAFCAGESWHVLGPNGSGKTTLLRVLLGVLPPRAGEVVRGIPRGEIGFVPQRSGLAETLPTTVAECVLLGLVGRRVGREERRQRLGWALERVRLAGYEHRSVHALSGGLRQRTLVARALVRRPRVLILDEPLTGLDLPTARALAEDLVRLSRLAGGPTLVTASHDLPAARRHATHALLLGGGRVRAGPMADVLRPEILAEAYGAPADTFRDAT